MVTYSVERAKTARSKCKGICKGKVIAKDDFRWCSHPDPENAKYDGQVFNSHLGCVTANVFHKAIALYGSLEDIPGVVESDALDAIRKAVEDAEKGIHPEPLAAKSPEEIKEEKAALKAARRAAKEAEKEAKAAMKAAEKEAKAAAKAELKAAEKVGKDAIEDAKKTAKKRKAEPKTSAVPAGKKTKKVPASPA